MTTEPLRYSDVPIACIHPDAATELAEQIMAPRREQVADPYWVATASRVLRPWLMAAAITGTELGRLAEQIHEAGARTALDALRTRPDIVPAAEVADLAALQRRADDSTATRAARAAILVEIKLALQATIHPDLPGPSPVSDCS